MQPSFPVVLLSILYVQYTELSIQKNRSCANRSGNEVAMSHTLTYISEDNTVKHQ